MRNHDVVVVGAGPAGTTTATLLARRGHDVLLLDKTSFPRDKPCAESLSPEVNVLLDRLGLPGPVEAAETMRLRGFVLHPEGAPAIRGAFASTGPRSYGLSIPRTAFDAALLAGARAAGVTVREGFRVGDVVREGGGIAGVRGRARGESGEEEVRARLTVGADGLHSTVGRRLGLTHQLPTPRRLALVTHMAGIAGLGEWGEMHLARDAQHGYVGVGPLGQGLANVSLVVPLAAGQGVKGRREVFFLDALRRFPALAPRLAGARPAKPILAIGPLAYRARRYSANGALLVGDAARFYDPLTGEGVYRALVAGELASTVLDAALRSGDVSAAFLSRFDRACRAAFEGKYLVERIIGAVIARPRLRDHVARRLARRPDLAATLMGVTGDFLPPRAVLRPGYLARLLV